MQQQLFKVRDKRNKGWFWIENEYFNGFGKILGANAIAVYVALCRHADGDQKCFPSQELLAEEIKVSKRTIIKILKQFEKHKIIEITKERYNGKWINNTYWLLDKSEWVYPSEIVSLGNQVQKMTQPSANNDKNQVQPVHTNNTHINNTHNKGGAFSPPSLLEVKNYCDERKNNVDAENFINFYESKGWVVGKTKMKSWRAAVRTWEGRDKKVDNNEEFITPSYAKGWIK